MTIEKIVEEVLKRLEALKNRKNMLCLVHEEMDYQAFRDVLKAMDSKNLKVGLISLGNPQKAVTVLEDLDIEVINIIVDTDILEWECFLKSYDVAMVTGLSVGEMYNLSVLNVNGKFEKLVWELVVSKLKIYGLKSFDLSKYSITQSVVDKVNHLYCEMSAMGIQWIGQGKGSATAKLSTSIDTNVITGDLLMGYQNCTVAIPEKAIVTPLAKDILVKNKIQLVRK